MKSQSNRKQTLSNWMMIMARPLSEFAKNIAKNIMDFKLDKEAVLTHIWSEIKENILQETLITLTLLALGGGQIYPPFWFILFHSK